MGFGFLKPLLFCVCACSRVENKTDQPLLIYMYLPAVEGGVTQDILESAVLFRGFELTIFCRWNEQVRMRENPLASIMAAQSYSKGINQQKCVRLFQYSDWLSRYLHLKLEELKIRETCCVNERHRKKC